MIGDAGQASLRGTIVSTEVLEPGGLALLGSQLPMMGTADDVAEESRVQKPPSRVGCGRLLDSLGKKTGELNEPQVRREVEPMHIVVALLRPFGNVAWKAPLVLKMDESIPGRANPAEKKAKLGG
ncbi:MAG: hypothetical protein SX243_07845 [Acidobacteriota bacterium]|nr:hypothetical protein [Acidobacteriota bacterium]